MDVAEVEHLPAPHLEPTERASGSATPLRRAPGVEDPEPVLMGDVFRHVRVSEHDELGVGEASGEPSRPAVARPAVVDDRDGYAVELDREVLREAGGELVIVVVAEHRVHRAKLRQPIEETP